MLKKVIKRNNQIEEFNATKLNKWAIWACHDLEDFVDWSEIATEAIHDYHKDIIHSQELQKRLIDACLYKKDYPHNLVAGRLYVSLIRKEIYGSVTPPTLYELHNLLREKGLIELYSYTKEDYEELEKIIDHNRDFDYAYFQHKYIGYKYSIYDRKENKQYETPQFMFMRVAMALAEDEPDRLKHVKKWYNYLSLGKLNAPTPNYINLGTKNKGFSSCCVYTSGDDRRSLAIGDFIAYTMTYMSAGIGSFINCRSINDPVRNGLIIHQGKLPYYKSLSSSVKANLQGSRGGAVTTYISCFDPEIIDILVLQNPRTPISKQNRDLHISMLYNKFFLEKAIKNEDIFTFNVYTAPKLMELFFTNNYEDFKKEYERLENDPNFKKNYISARKIALTALQQAHETGTVYFTAIDLMNEHTPFKDTIYSSNLCLEIALPTKPYYNMQDLYRENHHDSEIALCSLASIAVSNIESDEEYEDVCYYALKMIDKTIHLSEHEIPHLKYTAKMRLNAGVGITGLAHYLAKKGVFYNTKEGYRIIHEVAERHTYHLIKASLRLGKELGNAPWIHKTKWPEGWLPIDTYKKQVDTIANFKLKYDWEKLRQEVIANKGIRNSSLVAFMPNESSSKANGLPNSIYPVRNTFLMKTDGTGNIEWVAKDSHIYYYQLAWDIPIEDMIKIYSIFQKFTDQAISADIYINRVKNPFISKSDLLLELINMYRYGVKTRYYTNSLLDDAVYKEHEIGCVGGSCDV